MGIIHLFQNYKPPRNLRTLFIVHYAPLLLIILIGPITPLYEIWKIQASVIISVTLGVIIFILGAFLYFKWEIFWEKNYHGQLITEGIFKYIRHPHYTSLLIIGFGLAFFFNSIAGLLIAIIAIPIMIISIIDEERLLIKQYVEEYIELMKKTP
jgi:protein-S-isoprenylcysteine O-methyltransferase Ste14